MLFVVRRRTIECHCRTGRKGLARAVCPTPVTSTQNSAGAGSLGYGLPGQRFWSGLVGSRVTVTDPVSDLVFVAFVRAFLLLFVEKIRHLGICGIAVV